MSKKTVTILLNSIPVKVGPMIVKQPLPHKDLKQVSPFLLLHHAGPDIYPGNQPMARLNPHPHRGFEPVTFLFSGKLHHKDSLGNEGFLEKDDVQWMTAGSGIIHSEGPSKQFIQEGGSLELVQLWINLPRQYKMSPPKYQDIKSATIPLMEKNGFTIRLVAGNFEGMTGPAVTFTEIMALTAVFNEGATTTISVPEGWNTLVYLLEGELEVGSQKVVSHQLAVLDTSGDSLDLQATSKGKLLFLSGAPITEPMVTYGPFVMNYPGEIKKAILDYETGKMGHLES